ncbi:XrtA/PEP-CTERM system histidine kinase PrsK [Sphingosinicella sp.]|uniref:XrtA/PEP-CTERM system histidine kinase PrsK n=1 Tax=Sphingosinicella sp. TaxID=1917971 RepID=UPI0040379F26
MIGDLIILGSHLLAAALFGALAIQQLRRWADEPRHRPLVAAFAAVSLWAIFLAFLDPDAIATRFAESARNLAFLAFMHGLLKEAGEDDRQKAVKAVYAAVAGAIGVQIAVGGVTDQFRHLPLAFEALHSASQLLGLTIAAGALILVHNLYGQADPRSRAMLRLPTIALAAMWAFDLHLYTVGYMSPGLGGDLVLLRGPALVMLAPLFAFGLRGAPNWRFRLSRAATFQSVSLFAILLYFAAMMSASWVAGMIGGDMGRAAELALIAAVTAVAILVMTSARARSRARVFVAKHVFEHRYDYRREWARFTDTVGREQSDGAPLEERVIKGLADIAEAPGGLLLLVDDHDRLSPTARWNATATLPPSADGADALLRFVREHRYVLDFEQLRDGVLTVGEARVPVPDWLVRLDEAWAGVPLIHAGRLLGLVVLEHPAFRRRLDWEDLDLFRTVGVQAASYLAEARGQQALADARRFDEFNRRFAFILHDIKNLVSQLSLVSRNAERHADNPEFRADMIATLQGSVTKMNALLARLSPGAPRLAESPRETALAPVLAAVAAAKGRMRPVLVTGDADLVAHADPDALEEAIGHLVQNGIDASPADAPVGINYFESGGDVAIEIVDTGCGMSGDFVATRLFQPFVSTKEEGFGIGAHEARALILGMGGRVEVESAPGRGTCFTIYLPGAFERVAATSERIRA